MELTFSEAAKGANKELNVNIDDTCPRCNGDGSEPGTKVSQCHYCGGTGMVSFTMSVKMMNCRYETFSGRPCRISAKQGHCAVCHST